MEQQTPTYLTTSDVAKLLKVSFGHVQKEIRRGHLRAYRVANQWRITIEQVREWLETDPCSHPAPEADDLNRWWERSGESNPE